MWWEGLIAAMFRDKTCCIDYVCDVRISRCSGTRSIVDLNNADRCARQLIENHAIPRIHPIIRRAIPPQMDSQLLPMLPYALAEPLIKAQCEHP